jgi:CheY-like chemotaxis protein
VSILSRINEFTKSRNDFKRTLIDLKEIIEDAIEMTRPRLDSNNVEMKTSYSGDLHFMGDRAMIGEVFSNLINNAIDAIEDRGSITINVESDENEISVQFFDTGSGMDSQTLEKIFTPFFTTKGRQGTGLGLSMVYSIIDGHDGQVKVESEKGKGTKFFINLPRKELRAPLSKLSILIVEDDANLKNVLSEYFIESGAKTATAETYGEAIEILKSNQFDIMITDLGLPDKDGWGLIDIVKSSMPQCYIIPMTGWNKEIDRKELVARGLTDLLLKPFTLEQVQELIDSYRKRKADVCSIA